MNLGLESLLPKIRKEATTSFEQMYVAGLEAEIAVINADTSLTKLMQFEEGYNNLQKIVNVIEKNGVQDTLLDLHGDELTTILHLTSGMDKEVALENLMSMMKSTGTKIWEWIQRVWKWIKEVAAAAWAAIMRQYGMLTGGVKRVTTAKPAEREAAVKQFISTVHQTNKPSGTWGDFSHIEEFDYYMSYVVGVTSVFEHRMYAEDKLDAFLRNCYKEIKDLSTDEADKVYVTKLKEVIEAGQNYTPSTGKVAVMWNKFFTTFIRRYPKHFKKMVEYSEQRGNTTDNFNDRFGVVHITHNGTPIAEETKATISTDKIDQGFTKIPSSHAPTTLEEYGWTADVTGSIDIPYNFAMSLTNEMTSMQKEGSKLATQWEALVKQYADKGIDTTALTTLIATRAHTTANYITLSMHCSRKISEMISNVVNYMNVAMDPKTKSEDKFGTQLDQAIQEKNPGLVKSVLVGFVDTDKYMEKFQLQDAAEYASQKLKKLGVKLFEPDDGSFTLPPESKWDEAVLRSLKVNIQDNFSREKLEMIREVMTYLRKSGNPKFQITDNNASKYRKRLGP